MCLYSLKSWKNGKLNWNERGHAMGRIGSSTDLYVLLIGELAAARGEVGIGLGARAGHVRDAFEPMLAAETGRKRVVLEFPQRGREFASGHGSGSPRRGVRSGCGRNAVVELVVKHLPTGHRRTRTSSAPCDDTGALHSQALRRPARLQPSFVHPVHPPSPSLTLQQRQPGQLSAFNHILRCSEILSFQAGCGSGTNHRWDPSSFSRTDIPKDVHSTRLFHHKREPVRALLKSTTCPWLWPWPWLHNPLLMKRRALRSSSFQPKCWRRGILAIWSKQRQKNFINVHSSSSSSGSASSQ